MQHRVVNVNLSKSYLRNNESTKKEENSTKKEENSIGRKTLSTGVKQGTGIYHTVSKANYNNLNRSKNNTGTDRYKSTMVKVSKSGSKEKAGDIKDSTSVLPRHPQTFTGVTLARVIQKYSAVAKAVITGVDRTEALALNNTITSLNPAPRPETLTTHNNHRLRIRKNRQALSEKSTMPAKLNTLSNLTPK